MARAGWWRSAVDGRSGGPVVHPVRNRVRDRFGEAPDEIEDVRPPRLGPVTPGREGPRPNATSSPAPQHPEPLPPPRPGHGPHEPDDSDTGPGADPDGLDALDESPVLGTDADDAPHSPTQAWTGAGLGLYDAETEARQW